MFGSRGISFFSNIFLGANEQDMMNVEQLYEKAGCGTSKTKLGLYQKVLILLVAIQSVFIKGFFFGVSFFTKLPNEKDDPWRCLDENGNWPSCTKEQFCNKTLFDYTVNKIDYVRIDKNLDASENFYGMAYQLNLMCDKQLYGDMIGSFMFFGWAVGCSFIGTIADRYGRKVSYVSCSFAAVFLSYVATQTS